VFGAAGAPTDRIAGSRLPPAPLPMPGPTIPVGPATTPRPATPPPWAQKDPTRLDVQPLREPTPSGPVPSRPMPAPAGVARRGNRVRSVVFTVLAIVAAALVGILVASLLSSGKNNNGGDGQAGTSVSQPAPETSAESAPESPEETSETSPTQAPTAADYENAIRDYYGLLPANPDAAWQLMTPRAQAKSGSKQRYDQFWNGIQSVEVLSARAQGDRVAATLRFVRTNNQPSTEAYSFALVQQNGQLLIDNFVPTGRGEDGDG
jgi:eukaryotic-like serine/threonine-protein kinase